MDLLFGTYRRPDHEPEAFGVIEEMPKGYLRQLLHPFKQAGSKNAKRRTGTNDEIRY